LSPEGYYRDSVDEPRLADAVRAAGSPAVVDGVFLQVPVLRRLFTCVVYLRVSEAESVRRALARDVAIFGSPEEVTRRYRHRYLPGQRLYRAEVDPESLADVLVDNEDVRGPRVVRWRLPTSQESVSAGRDGRTARPPRRGSPR
jgi:uridine kinase